VGTGNLGLVQQQLEAGVDPRVRRMDHYQVFGRGETYGLKRQTSLIAVATYYGNGRILELLVEGGADVNAADMNGTRPIHVAAYYGQREMLELLIERGADLPGSLCNASEGNHKDIAVLLMERYGVDVDARGRRGQSTPLHEAVRGGHMELVELLLNSGADLEATVAHRRGRYGNIEHGMTAMDLAIHHGCDEVAVQLLKAGVDTTTRPYLDRAIRKRRDVIVQSMRELAGPDVILPDLRVLKEIGAKVVRQNRRDTIKSISLDNTAVTDADLYHLGGRRRIRSLNLANTQIGDKGLIHVRTLDVSELNLASTEITDAGLVHLKMMTGLRTLNLQCSKVTDEGLAELKKALPKCEINE